MEVFDIRRRAREGAQSFGLVMGMTDPFILEMAYAAGFHFVRIDCEHCFIDKKELRTLFDAARNIGIAAQIRIPDLKDIDALLALEPAGICIPDMDSVEKAEEAVEKIKFPPYGKRGMGMTRSIRLGYTTRKDFAAQCNDKLNLIVQIENLKGIENIDSILSVEGIDMVASGRSDLAGALGCPGDRDNPVVMEAEDMIIRKAKEHGKILTLSVSKKERLDELCNQGVYCYSIGRDEEIFLKALKDKVKKMQS